MATIQSELIKVDGRILFAHGIFERFQGKPDAKYSCQLTDMDDHTVRKLERTADNLVQEKWQGKIKSRKQLAQFFLHDGEEKMEHEGFKEGVPYISASNQTKPTVVDRDGRTLIDQASGRIYSGCHVRLYLNLWVQDNAQGKGINASLRGVQFLRDGDPIGGGTPLAIDDFDEADETPEETDDMEGLL